MRVFRTGSGLGNELILRWRRCEYVKTSAYRVPNSKVALERPDLSDGGRQLGKLTMS